KNKNYALIGELLYSKYYIKDFYQNITISKNYTFLGDYHRCLEDYVKNHFNKISGLGHYLITNLSNKIDKDTFILADLICHYIQDLYFDGDISESWFPATF